MNGVGGEVWGQCSCGVGCSTSCGQGKPLRVRCSGRQIRLVIGGTTAEVLCEAFGKLGKRGHLMGGTSMMKYWLVERSGD